MGSTATCPSSALRQTSSSLWRSCGEMFYQALYCLSCVALEIYLDIAYENVLLLIVVSNVFSFDVFVALRVFMMVK